jgi:hypothetical protein
MKKKRQLTDRDPENSFEIEYPFSKHAADQIAKEIDFGILTSMLQELGWVKIVLTPMTHETSDAIDEWIRITCKKGVETMGLVWVFEDHREAAWFSLRWS